MHGERPDEGRHYLERELYERLQSDPAIFEFLQAGSLDGLWYWDLVDQEHEWLSPRFKEVFGYSVDEVPHTSDWWQANIFEEDLAKAAERFQQHIDDPSVPYDLIVRYRHKNGSTVWIRCRGIAIRDEDGTPTRMLGAHTDLTPLMISRQRLSSLFEGSADHVVTLDSDRRSIVDVSTLFAEWAWGERRPPMPLPLEEVFSASSVEALSSAEDPEYLVWRELTHVSSSRGVLVVEQAKREDSRLVVRAFDASHLERLQNVAHLLQRLPTPALIARPDGTVVATNPALRSLSPACAVHCPTLDQVGVEGLAEWFAEPDALPTVLTTTGTPARSLAVTRSVVEVGQEPAMILGFVDITERESMARRLQATESELRRTLELSPGAYFALTWDGAGSVSMASRGPRLVNTLGEVPATDPWRHVVADHRDELMLSLEAAARDGEVWHQIFLVAHPQRGQRWIEGQATPVRDGAATTFYGFLLDVTERETAGIALRSSREKLHTALEAGGMSAFSVEFGTGEVGWDHNASAVLGHPTERLPATIDELLALFMPESERAARAKLAHVLEHGGATSSERGIRDADGNERWIALTGRARPDVSGFEGVVWDVTDRRKEEAGRIRSQNLESLGTLAGGIAHDFNNILFAMTGNLAMATAELATGHPAQEYLHELKRGAARASALVKRILAFSRPAEDQNHAIRCRPIVVEAVELLRASLPRKVRLTLSDGPVLPLVNFEGTEVHQIVVNLVTNASQAIGEERGEIALSLDRVRVRPAQAELLDGLDPGTYVRLTVRDDGPGMPPSVQKRIFDPFFTTKGEGSGTGLGLSVVHGLVQSRGGAISVYSAVDKGTVFHVYLPLAEADPVRSDDPPVGASARRLVYIDDELAIVRVAQRVLERQGYQVDVFTDPLAALASIEKAAPDALVTDLSMPELSGIELIREVRKVHPDLPIVLTTGHLPPSLEVQARSLGVEHVVLKSDMVEQLGGVLRLLFPEGAQSIP